MTIENIYIKDRLVGEEDYRKLAEFFGEPLTEGDFWNLVLAKASETNDSKVRWILAGVATNPPERHGIYKQQMRDFYRAKRFIHRIKRDSGRAKGLRGAAAGASLFLNTTLPGQVIFFIAGITLPGLAILGLMRLFGR